jgi:Tol biopolymer transport system component
MSIRLSRSILLFHAAALALAPIASIAIERISVQGNGGESNDQSRYPAISGDGRYVVFNSDASNLVAGDTNGMADLFVRDRVLGTTTRISVGPNGAQGDGPSYTAAISGDGSRIVFASHAHLLPASGYQNCYLLDRSAQTLQVLDLLPNGQPATTCASPSIDYTGTKVALVSLDALDAVDTGGYDVYVRNLAGSALTRVSRSPGGGPTNGSNTDARLSGDGSRVIFASSATNLVAGDSNGETDIFLAATDNSVPTVRVNVGPGNTQASAPGGTAYLAALNAVGSLVAFSSKAQSLPDASPDAESTLYLRLPGSDQTLALSIPLDGLPREGTNGEPDFDYSGRWLVFASTDTLFAGAEPGIYVIDLVDAWIALVSVGGNTGNVHEPRISADGRGIVWYSLSTTQVAGDTNGTWDVFYANNPLWVDTPIFTDGFDG